MRGTLKAFAACIVISAAGAQFVAAQDAHGGEDVFLGNLGVVLDRNDHRASLGRRDAGMILDAGNMFFFLALR
jgi:hypothetical protein